jgi:hypothetical protein
MPTPEELALEEAKKQSDLEAAKKIEEEARAKELSSIPEPLRGKSQKELVDLLLQNSVEVEKIKSQYEEEKRQLDSKLAQYQPKPPSDEELEAQKERELFTKPFKVLDEYMEKKLAPLKQVYITDKEKQADEWAKSHFKDYPKYAPKMKEMLKTISPELRGSQEVIEAVYRHVKFPDVEARLQEMEAKSGLYVEGVGSPPSSGSPKEPDLSEEEERARNRFGISKEDWIKSRDSLSLD